MKRKRRKFTDEFKQETVRLVREGGKSIGEVSRDLDLTESAVRQWVRQAEIDAGRGGTGALASAEPRNCSGCGVRTSSCRWSAKS